MKRLFYFLVLFLAICAPISARQKISGYAEKGGKLVKTSPAISYTLQESYPLSTITVYKTGTLTLASIYSNNSGTVKSNPFTSDSTGYYEFYADNGCYDIKLSGLGIVTPFTRANICIYDSSEALGVDATLYTNLSSAILAMGSSQATLIISKADYSSGGTIIVPQNITVQLLNQGTINTNAGNVTIRGEFLCSRKLAFTGSGTVSFDRWLPNFFCPEWWGAKGDNSTDDLPAFNKLNDSVKVAVGAKVIFNPYIAYYLSSTWSVDFVGTFEGLSSQSGYPVSTFRIAANKTGIIINDFSTKTGTNDGRMAENSIFKNFSIEGSVGGFTHTGTISGLTVTVSSGSPTLSDGGGLHGGQTVTYNNSDIGSYELIVDSFVNATHFTIKPPRVLGIVKNGSPYVYNVIGSGDSRLSSWMVGRTININGVDKTITAVDNTIDTGSNGHGRITLDSNVSGVVDNLANFLCTSFSSGTCYEQTMVVDGLTSSSPQSMRPNLYHGLDFRVSYTLENVYIKQFAGNCLNNDSILLPNSSPQTFNNQNVAYVIHNKFYFCSGNGIYTKGTNANQINTISNDSSDNHGAGIAEYSLLGNHYNKDHLSFDLNGGINAVQGTVNLSTFSQIYEEGGMPSSYSNDYSMSYDGNHGSGFTGGGSISHLAGWTNIDSAKFSIGDGINSKLISLGISGPITAQPNTFIGFGAAEDSVNTGVGGTVSNWQRGAYQLGYNQLATGWYDFYYGGNYSNHSNSIIAFSGSTAADGGGLLWLPAGIKYITRTDVGLYGSAANVLKITNGTSGRGYLDTLGIMLNGGIPITSSTGSGGFVLGISPIIGTPTINTPTINNGTINNATENTPTIATPTITNGSMSGTSIDNAIIGNTTRAVGNFTTINANGQINSTVATGTAPITVNSITPIANMIVAAHSKFYNTSGTLQTNLHEVFGTATLSTGTLTVTFSGSAIFANTSYICTGANQTNANAFKIVNTSASQITITGTGSDVIGFRCVGS